MFFSKELAGINMHKSKLYLNKPVCTGMTILDNSEILICDFYNTLKKDYGLKCKVLYTDTDTLLL